VPPSNLRRTISATLWRHQNGAKWRAIPEGLGPWWMAARTFIRWSRLGVWERLLVTAQQSGIELGHGVPRWHFDPRPPEGVGGGQKGAAPMKHGVDEALGRSRGGYGTKACVIADSAGRAVAFALAPGQAHELPQAVPLLGRLPDVPMWVVANRGYSSHAFREHIWNPGARPAIPTRRGSRLSPARRRSTITVTASSAYGPG
jgi:transposase